MKKMLPEGAVRHKMMQEGIPDAEIEAFFNGTLGAAAAPAAPAAPGQHFLSFVCFNKATSSLWCAAMDPKFEKYAKMKKMLPEGAVRQKMMQEGISDAEIEAFFNGTLGAAAAPAAPAAPGKQCA
jgi:hypothetical protein